MLVIFILYLSSCFSFIHQITHTSKYINNYHNRNVLFAVTTEKTTTSKSEDYSSDAITVLKGLEPVRKRPGMYIGSTGLKGLHHLVYEVVDNSVDESLAGHCTEITVIMNSNGSIEVIDNGRGIPCAIHPATGKSSLETVLCVLHAGGKFGGDASGYKVSGGLHGVGLSVVNALSEKLVVEVVRDNAFHTMTFSKGIPLHDIMIRPVLPNEKRGTKVCFFPDGSIFKTSLVFDFDKLAVRFDELAYLNAGLTIHLIDKRTKEQILQQQQAMKLLQSQDGYDDDEIAEFSNANNEKNTIAAEVKPPINTKTGKNKKVLIKATNEDENKDNTDSMITTTTAVAASDLIRKQLTFRHDGGIKELVKVLCEGKTPLLSELVAKPSNATSSTTNKNTKAKANLKATNTEDGDIIYMNEDRKGINVQVAMRWSSDHYVDALTGFANGIRTPDGGSHLDGLKAAITKTVNNFAKKNGKIKDVSIPGEFVREGLTAVISVKVPEPEFEGQTKTRLGNPEVRQIVDSVVTDALQVLFEWNPAIFTAICNKALAAQAASIAAKAAREMVRRKSLLTSTVLPGKLADCASRNPAESEIYIVEGDSAAGSAKLGRDRRTQAILPLKGKILNIEKASNDKIYQNTELQALISALGLGVRGVSFDIELLRYHRIVIMTDADVDGAHIRLLLLTFFYRYQRELLANGHVYIACPPLYKVISKTFKSKGKSVEVYIYDQAAMDIYLKQLPPDVTPQIQRFKGLGEMMPTQLWDTTMDPTRRTLKLVNIEDAAAADKMFTMLMGDNVVHRKEFIISNVEDMKLSDLDY